METFWNIFCIGLVLCGMIGGIMPFFPGTLVILAGAAGHWLALERGESVSLGTLIGMGLLLVVGQVADFLCGGLGAKWFGASRWGLLGTFLGAVAGMFFGLWGLILGPLVGALAGELLSGKHPLLAGKATWGALVGTAAGTVVKFILGVVMGVWFFVDLWWS